MKETLALSSNISNPNLSLEPSREIVHATSSFSTRSLDDADDNIVDSCVVGKFSNMTPHPRYAINQIYSIVFFLACILIPRVTQSFLEFSKI